MFFYFDNISISHVASCVPRKVVPLTDFSPVYGESEVRKIINTTGIASIRKADERTTTADLCFQAAENIFTNYGVLRNDIDAVVFVSQTPEYRLPQTSIVLQDRLKLSKNTICMDVPLGCSGYVFGLFQASMLVKAGCKKVLLLAGDTSTKLINSLDRSVTMVFGDAGSASIIQKGNQEIYGILKSDGSGFDRLIIKAGGFRNPSTEETSKVIKQESGDYRSDEDLYMDGMAIMNFAISEVPIIIKELLEKCKWDQNEVDIYALHQANTFMLNYLRKKMKISTEKVPIRVDTYGNTGPASIPLMLTSLLSDGTPRSLNKSILCGFGVGLSWGAIATSLQETIFCNITEF